MDDGIESRHDPREPEPPPVELAARETPAMAWEAAANGTASRPESSRRRRRADRSWWSRRSGAAKGALVFGTILVVLLAIGALTRNRGSSDSSESARPSSTREHVSTSKTATTESTMTTPSTTTTTLPPPTTPAPPPPTAPPATATAPPAPTAAPQVPSCNPNYGGCVPNDSDVDCEGGSGDGPAYVRGPVQIIGGDVYGLDSDHDGVGCE